MSRTPARVTQADVARVIRAAKQAGAGSVRIMPDGTIKIDIQPEKLREPQENEIAPRRRLVL
jgi:hypothetical protein